VRPYVTVAEYLASLRLSAPRILAKDEVRGLLLLEDLGDDLFSRLLAKDASQEEAYYREAVTLLADLAGRATPNDLPRYDDALLQRELGLFTEWFIPAALAEKNIPIAEFHALWEPLLSRLHALPQVLVLRDYHADNLLWLPERSGIARVGLLDFQDAVVGAVPYDLASLLEDARRDVPAALARKMKAHFLSLLPQLDAASFEEGYAIMAAQRNLKIIGIFTRLCVRDGKPRYLSMLPRVWAHLANDLQVPALKPVREWMEAYVPQKVRTATPLVAA
jgi:aminoglycoside/choline kinase family phosphotransferase